ncbi:XRE family transcriptional regulator [Romboutsia ilealis]|uniref:Helix-turn-helix transcriptional regulator n=1 Tax=Romboutsia faecis TaxID=2764597 RepID=A0ABR7JPD4_9FIRM|nr:helix-turn-helix transcriptional regulator [Romboutsia faecis]MBC5996762.1 helix-turn-helix transcriptional regulator [Romboutsia faecis]MRN24289.1 XRE family transcriptional regulator [Romboutsia ilealis]
MNERLKLIRKNLGLSQKKFGEKIHLSVSQISSYENKFRNIPERTILNIIREFNINPDWLRYGKGDMFDNTKSIDNLIYKINSLSEEDQLFINRIIDCLYKSSCDNKSK